MRFLFQLILGLLFLICLSLLIHQYFITKEPPQVVSNKSISNNNHPPKKQTQPATETKKSNNKNPLTDSKSEDNSPHEISTKEAKTSRTKARVLKDKLELKYQ